MRIKIQGIPLTYPYIKSGRHYEHDGQYKKYYPDPFHLLKFLLQSACAKEGRSVRIGTTETAIEVHRLIASTHLEHILAE